MKHAKWIGIAMIVFVIFSTVDGIAYTIYSFSQGYYFIAPINHIIAFHSSGLGLVALVGMIFSAVAVVGLTLWK